MRPIPKRLRERMAADPFYSRCCITGATAGIQWHHNMVYSGRQVNEAWAILPVCGAVHSMAKQPNVRLCLDYIMLSRALDYGAKLPVKMLTQLAATWLYACREIRPFGVSVYLANSGVKLPACQ